MVCVLITAYVFISIQFQHHLFSLLVSMFSRLLLWFCFSLIIFLALFPTTVVSISCTRLLIFVICYISDYLHREHKQNSCYKIIFVFFSIYRENRSNDTERRKFLLYRRDIKGWRMTNPRLTRDLQYELALISYYPCLDAGGKHHDALSLTINCN